MRITRWLARRSLAVTPEPRHDAAILVGLTAALFASRGGYRCSRSPACCSSSTRSSTRWTASSRGCASSLASSDSGSTTSRDDIVDNLFIVSCGHVVGGVWVWLGIAAAAGRVFVSLTVYVDVYRSSAPADVVAFRWWFETESRPPTSSLQSQGAHDVAPLARSPRHLRVRVDARVPRGLPVLGRGPRPGDRRDQGLAVRGSDHGVQGSAWTGVDDRDHRAAPATAPPFIRYGLYRQRRSADATAHRTPGTRWSSARAPRSRRRGRRRTAGSTRRPWSCRRRASRARSAVGGDLVGPGDAQRSSKIGGT